MSKVQQSVEIVSIKDLKPSWQSEAWPLLNGSSVIRATINATQRARVRTLNAADVFRVGFVPMVDCAPVVVAHAMGLFAKHGVSVRLSREIGWASIRDRLLHRELHAAHASATMAFAMRCGLGSLAVPCLSAAVLAHNGSAITLSMELRKHGVTDGESFGRYVMEVRGKRRLRLAAVFHYSTQHDNLKCWLTRCGLNPERDVEIVLIPSPLVHRSLAAGHIDGYCVAEPWNSQAVLDGTGWTVASDLARGTAQVEKVLLVLERFEREFPEAHLSMVCAVLEASQLCADLDFRSECIRILASPSYFDVSPEVLKPSLGGRLGAAVGGVEFGANQLGNPTRELGRQIFQVLNRIGVPEECRSFRRDIIPKIFREDLYARAVERLPFYPPAGSAQNAALVNHPCENPDRYRAA